MQPHPYAYIFPTMSKKEFYELSGDVAKRGQLEPIVTYQGMILDGRNRWAACEVHKITPKTVKFKGTDEEALNFVISKNLHRRNLKSSQRAVVALKYEEHLAEIAKERQREAGKAVGGDQKSEGARANKNQVPQKTVEADPGAQKPEPAKKSRDGEAVVQAAKACGTNPEYVRMAKYIREHDCGRLDEISRDENSIPKVYEEVKAAAKAKEDAADQAATTQATEQQTQETPEPRKAKTKPFDPENRWKKKAEPLLMGELGQWPSEFRAIFASYLKEWVSAIDDPH